MEKILYFGIEDTGLTYCGEYEVVCTIVVCGKSLGVVVVGDDGRHHMVKDNYIMQED